MINTAIEHIIIKGELGRVIAQAVSRWFTTAAARVRVRAEHEGFVVGKAALQKILVFFSKVLNHTILLQMSK
jgi:hypothetical protein